MRDNFLYICTEVSYWTIVRKTNIIRQVFLKYFYNYIQVNYFHNKLLSIALLCDMNACIIKAEDFCLDQKPGVPTFITISRFRGKCSKSVIFRPKFLSISIHFCYEANMTQNQTVNRKNVIFVTFPTSTNIKTWNGR